MASQQRLAGVALVTDLTTGRATERWASGPESEPPDLQPEQPPSPPPPVLSDGVGLSRLLVLARLTAAQALEIGASVLADAARRAELDGAAPGSDRLTVDQVVVLPDGRAVLVGGWPAAGPAGAAAGTVLADLAGAARLPGRRTDPAADPILAALERAATELPAGGAPAVAGMLRDAAAGLDRPAVRAELAALVAAVRGGVAPSSGSGPAGASPAVGRAAPARRATRGRARTARRWIGAWLLSILVLGGVVVLEVAVLRDKISTDIGLLLDAGRSGSQPSAAPQPDGLPVVPPAPAAAGSVLGVDLRSLGACTPGTPCTMRLLVRLAPGAGPQVVTWSYLVVDRCTGLTSTAPGGTVTVPAQGTRAAAVGTVALPAVPGAGVVAVTQLPATAASSPVLVGSCLPDPQAK